MIMKRWKLKRSEGIKLLDERKIRSVGEDDGYKYLVKLEVDDVMHEVMKTNMTKEYTRRVKKVLTSKLKGGNVIKAINSWAVSLRRCSGGRGDKLHKD